MSDALTSFFASWTGQPPQGVYAAPGRVNLIGEHTDYNGGWALPLALDLRTTVALRTREDATVRVRSMLDELGQVEFTPHVHPGDVTGWAAYCAGVAWALRQAGHDLGGFDLLVDRGVPHGSGLSSSAAFSCAVATALVDAFALEVDGAEIAQLARRAENDFVGAPTGIMDQIAVMFGRRDHAVLIDCATAQHTPVPFRPRPDGLTLLVINTGVAHDHAEGEYAERRRSCEQAAAQLGVPTLREATAGSWETLTDPVLRRRTRHVMTENARVHEVVALLNDGRVADIGPVLDDSHESLRTDFEVSCPELDVAVESARAAGALVARMTGGGFGGCAIALAPTDAVESARAAVVKRYHEHGWRQPDILHVAAADGAHRVG